MYEPAASSGVVHTYCMFVFSENRMADLLRGGETCRRNEKHASGTIMPLLAKAGGC